MTKGPAFCPTHPGALLRDDVLPALDLTISAAAEHLGVSRVVLHRIMRAEKPASVTPEMALRLGKLVGNGPRLWLNMQAAYDLWRAEKRVDTSAIPTLKTSAA